MSQSALSIRRLVPARFNTLRAQDICNLRQETTYLEHGFELAPSNFIKSQAVSALRMQKADKDFSKINFLKSNFNI